MCQKGLLLFRDYCKRIIRSEDGSHEWIMIPRHQCDNPKCRKIHRMLPDTLVPYKHYPEETISGVLDEVVGPDDMDSENFPSEKSMERWHHWFIFNRMMLSVGSLSGIVVDFIGAIFIKMYTKNIEAAVKFHAKFAESNNLLLANSIAHKIDDNILRETTLSEIAKYIILAKKYKDDV